VVRRTLAGGGSGQPHRRDEKGRNVSVFCL
jgi:hypothetical protein